MQETEQIQFVNEDGTPTGEVGPKLASHTAHTRLHLAFSSYIFNDKGEFLATQRALKKKVWPSVWTNSCCGHVAPGETIEQAIARRLQYELGMTADNLQVLLPEYRYVTPPYNGIIENEFCPVYIGHAASQPTRNPEEVEDLKWIPWQEYAAALEHDEADTWAWWAKDQYKQLKDSPLIRQFAKTSE